MPIIHPNTSAAIATRVDMYLLLLQAKVGF